MNSFESINYDLNTTPDYLRYNVTNSSILTTPYNDCIRNIINTSVGVPYGDPFLVVNAVDPNFQPPVVSGSFINDISEPLNLTRSVSSTSKECSSVCGSSSMSSSSSASGSLSVLENIPQLQKVLQIQKNTDKRSHSYVEKSLQRCKTKLGRRETLISKVRASKKKLLSLNETYLLNILKGKNSVR
jgi:hypothetical protein